MSAKVKLISFISAFVLVLGIMIIGVLSAEQVQVNIGGSVSFNATNVYAKVSGNISRAKTGNKTFSTLTYSAEETTGDESDWTNLDLNFDSDATPILIEITVENLSTDRELQVSLENDIQASGLNISITKDSQPYTAGNTAMLPASTGDGSSTTTFVMSLTVANPDENLTDANFNYILNMTDESAIKEITAQSANNSMGSVTGSGSFVIGEQVTLTATPGQNYLFTEWRANSADGERVSTSSTYTFTLTSTSPTTYYAVFERAQAGTLTYTYDDETKTATVSGCTSGATKVVIPETTIYNGETYTVTGIATGTMSSGPFYSTHSTLKSITIPSTIETIGDFAFYYCRALTEINFNAINCDDFAEGESWSGKRAFDYAGTESEGVVLNIGASVTKIPSHMFLYNQSAPASKPNIITVNFADNSACESIGERAFYDCDSLTSITIPASVSSIGSSVFYNSSNLTSVEFDNNSQLTSIGDRAFYGCSSLTSVDFGNNSQLTSIGYSAFYNCSNLASVDFGNNSQLTTINNSAFQGCSSLTSITIPEGVTSIGDWAFSGCYALAEVYNYSSVNSSSDGGLDYYAKVVYNASDLTDSKPATRIKADNGVRYYDDGENAVVALYPLSRDITTVSLDSRTTEINQHAFDSCSSLTIITIPNRVTSIGDYAFRDCSSLTSITIPDSVTSIGNNAFGGCSSLTSITIGEGVTSIGESAFFGCSSLTSITIPESVTSIGSTAIDGCSKLTSIDVDPANTTYSSEDGVLFNKDKTTLVAYPAGNTRTLYTVPDSITSIGDHAFEDCTNLTSVNFGDNSQLTTIGYCAFDGCSSLTSITIPSSVTSIGKYAFSDCSKLTTVNFENQTGWFTTNSSSATSGTPIDDLSDPAQNAERITGVSGYYNRYWKRS